MLRFGSHSADFKKVFLERKSKLYEVMTLEELVQKIAEQYGYEFAVADSLKEIEIKAKQQADESDANLLTRLAEDYDAVATIKIGELLFLERGAGKTASGQQIPVITHQRSDGNKHNYSVNDCDHYTGVEARYLLPGKAKRRKTLVGKEGRVYCLRMIFEDEKQAQIAAEKELLKLNRGKASINASLARGNPNLTAESPLKLVGFKSELDAENWIVITATHNLTSGNGVVTELMGEMRS